MSIFKRLFGSVNELKESVEQKEITNKINNLYESIVKGVEELNAKVNSVKELKEKLKNLPPPPENAKETSSDEANKPEGKKTDEKSDKVPLPALLPPIAAPPKPATSSSSEYGSGSGTGSDEKPGALPPPPAFGAPPIAKPNTDSSPLPMHGAAEVIPRDSLDSPDYDGGKKRKTRAKAKRTISKNKNNSNKRTRKNKNKDKNKDKEATPESASAEAAI